MKHKWIETHGLCVKYILYIKGKTQMLRAIMAKPCCPNGYEKDKNWEKKYFALEEFKSSRNGPKDCPVCNIHSIHQRIAPNPQGKG